jgi:AAA domain
VTQWPERLQFKIKSPRLDQGAMEELRRWADAAKKPRLIVIDTFACVRPARSRNDGAYDADYAALSPLQVMAGELNLAVLVVHHVRKMDSDDAFDTVSGTLGLVGAADTVLVLKRDARGVILHGRGRDIDEIERAMRFDKTTGRWSILGEADDVRKSDERKSIVEALRATGETTVSQLIAATGMKRNALERLLHKMVRGGEVERTGRGRYRLP